MSADATDALARALADARVARPHGWASDALLAEYLTPTLAALGYEVRRIEPSDPLRCVECGDYEQGHGGARHAFRTLAEPSE